jgi:Na+/melibiose symporter-like transporter
MDDDRSLGDLLKSLTGEFQRLVRAEIELARVETRDEVAKAKEAGVRFGIAAGAAILAAVLLSFAAAWLLAELMPVGLAFLIVGVTYAAVALWAWLRARERARDIDPIPEQTVATLKEDVQWARARSN